MLEKHLFVSDLCLPNLISLDLTGVLVLDSRYMAQDRALPRKVTRFVLRDSEISIYNDGILRIIKEQKILEELDLGLTHVTLPILTSLSKALPQLKSLSLAGKPENSTSYN